MLIPTEFRMAINGNSFMLSGELDITPNSGFCTARVNYNAADLPKGFPIEAISFCTITGYPGSGKTIGRAENLYDDLKADFVTTRKLELPGYGKLETTYHSIDRGTDDEEVVFEIGGEVMLPELNGIRTTVEQWFPAGPGRFHGTMPFVWDMVGGGTVMGFAETDYRLETKMALSRPQFRVITFELETTDTEFIQREHIKNYDATQWASEKSNLAV